jgi:hypothetical protein
MERDLQESEKREKKEKGKTNIRVIKEIEKEKVKINVK